MLDEQVKDAHRHRPAEGQVTAELGRAEVGHEQRRRVGRIGWFRAEFAAPLSHEASRSQLPRYHADRARQLAGTPSAPELELKIDTPDLAE
jgi:hypothetical protein